jgi:hypothetical protein
LEESACLKRQGLSYSAELKNIKIFETEGKRANVGNPATNGVISFIHN